MRHTNQNTLQVKVVIGALARYSGGKYVLKFLSYTGNRWIWDNSISNAIRFENINKVSNFLRNEANFVDNSFEYDEDSILFNISTNCLFVNEVIGNTIILTLIVDSIYADDEIEIVKTIKNSKSPYIINMSSTEESPENDNPLLNFEEGHFNDRRNRSKNRTAVQKSKQNSR